MFSAPVLGYMTPDPIGVSADTTLEVARAIMDEAHVSALPVLDDHRRAVGVLSRWDLLHAGATDHGLGPSPLLALPNAQVGSVMGRELVTVAPSTSLREAAQLMLDRHIHHVYVEAKRELVGVVSTTDLMRAVAGSGLLTPLRSLMHRPVACIPIDTPVSLALAELESHGVTGLAVMEDDEPVGMFTEEAAIAAREVDGDATVGDVMSQRFVVALDSTPVHRAAAHAFELDVRHVLVRVDRMVPGGRCVSGIVGVVTGTDLAGAVLLA